MVSEIIAGADIEAMLCRQTDNSDSCWQGAAYAGKHPILVPRERQRHMRHCHMAHPSFKGAGVSYDW